MESNQFDNNAKHRLSKHESQMDVDAFWDQLEPKLPKDKSRPKFFILILLAGILLCSGALGWYFFERIKQQKANEHSTEYPLQANKPVNDKNEIEHSELLNSQGIKDHPSALAEAGAANMKENDLVLNQKNNHQANSNADQMADESNLNLKNTVTKVKVRDQENGKSQSSRQIEKGDIKQNEFSTPIQREFYTDYLTKNFVLKSQSQSSVPGDEERSANFTETVNEQSKAQNGNSINDQIETPYFINNLPLILQSIKFKDLFVEVDLTTSVPNVDEFKLVVATIKNQLKMTLMPSIGIGWYSKDLSYSGTDDLVEYINLRKQSETNLEEWLFGMNVNLSYGQMGLLTGVEYVRRNEKFNYSSSKTENLFGSTAIRVETKDSFNMIPGTGWHGSTQIRKVVHHNSIQQWNVPLGLNYHFDLRGLRMTVGGGAMFSIANNIYGKTLDSGLNISEWNQTSDLSSQTNLGIGWFGELNCNLPITNHIMFQTGFRVQEFTGNYLNGPLELHYRSYLLRSGLVFNLY